ncbi:MFS transporter [Rugosimonospora acidiphila]|uniref:MFS transporter n=1 Tax=Rugosimonospora acidiphila TaxID=556531 RepID=A0ABP9RYD7_9ACTN
MRSRGFRRLLDARLASQLGDGAFQAALAGSLLFNPQQATGALSVAGGFAVLLLPYSIVGPYVGVVLDRWSRRTVIFTANLIRALLVLPAALLIWFGRESAPYILLALLIIGINRLFLAGLSAAMPHVVPERRLVTANALATTLGTLIYSLGLGAAAFILQVTLHKGFHGYAVLAVTGALGYAGSALLVRFAFERDELGPEDTTGQQSVVQAAIEVARGTVAGLRHLASRRNAAYAMLAQSLHRGIYGVLTLATLLLYRHYFYGANSDKALTGLAQIVVAGGFGSLVAAFITPRVVRLIGGPRWIAGLFGGAGILVLLGLPFQPVLLVIATFGVNITSQGTKIVVDTAIQRECDDDYRGRVFSVNDTAFNLFFVIGLFIAALALPADGHSVLAVVLVSTCYLALAGWYVLAADRAARLAIASR